MSIYQVKFKLKGKGDFLFVSATTQTKAKEKVKRFIKKISSKDVFKTFKITSVDSPTRQI